MSYLNSNDANFNRKESVISTGGLIPLLFSWYNEYMGAHILFFDIEMLPAIAYIWPPYYEPKFVREIKPQMIMSISYKWGHEDDVKFIALTDFYSLKSIKNGKCNDKKIVQKIKEVIDQADVIIGHNSDNFDIKHINTRLMYWGIEPTKFVEQDDTLKMARRTVKLASYKLDYICEYFNLGRKEGSHHELWFDCMQGNLEAWKNMKIYNDQDVLLTESLYNKLTLYSKRTVDVGKYVSDGELCCPRCGSHSFSGRGFRATNTRFKRDYKCRICKKRFQGKKSFSNLKDAQNSEIGV